MRMGFKRGDIHLVNFNPSKGTEAGKIRPAVIFQSDYLNDVAHPSTIVIPMTTQLIEKANPLRLRIKARDLLQQDSDVIIDQPRAIDNQRITSERLTTLTAVELLVLEDYLKIVLGFDK
jgi:mRNA interferase MazF